MHTLVGGEGAGGSCRGAGVRCRSEVQGCRCWVLRVRVVGAGGGCGGAGGRCMCGCSGAGGRCRWRVRWCGCIARVAGLLWGGEEGLREHILSALFRSLLAFRSYLRTYVGVSR